MGFVIGGADSYVCIRYRFSRRGAKRQAFRIGIPPAGGIGKEYLIQTFLSCLLIIVIYINYMDPLLPARRCTTIIYKKWVPDRVFIPSRCCCCCCLSVVSI